MNLNDKFLTLFNGYSELSKDRGIKFLYEIDESLNREIICDYRIIESVVCSLVDNAVKFTMEAGIVAVKVKYISEINTFKIDVKDSGIGIKSDDVEKIFNLFQQLDGSKTREFEGVGVGLFLAKKVVEYMNGTISVESEFGKGSLFSAQMQL
jgi:signal transduction histidine kinase